jgi:hypothetical protein
MRNRLRGTFFAVALTLFLPFGNTFLVTTFFRADISPLVPPDLEMRDFEDRLEIAVANSPIDPRTGRHQLMLSVVNEGMLAMTRNFLCSAHQAGIAPHEFLLVAFDLPSYQAVKYLTPSAVSFIANLSRRVVNNQQVVEFYRFLHHRTRIALALLRLGCDVLTADTDIVFISHFRDLFTATADLEVQHDSKSDINPNRTIPAPWKLNLGFHMWRSSPVTVALVGEILEGMLRSPKSHDQSVLRKLTIGCPMSWEGENLVVDLTAVLGKMPGATLRVRHLDGLRAVNTGGVFKQGVEKWRNAAIGSGVRAPVVMHFFHIGGYQEKIAMMKVTQLWHLDTLFDRCAKRRPKGAGWPWWDPAYTRRFQRFPI